MPANRSRNLRIFRQQHGLQAKEVAEILGYSRSYISRCETGSRQLSPNAWKALEAHVAGFGSGHG
jgi:transcriptional regulator with XRE-family HTH domain